MRQFTTPALIFSLGLSFACGGSSTSEMESTVADEEDLPEKGSIVPTDGPLESKGDNVIGRRGPLVATDTSRTQVWSARNRWEDRDTPAARKSGIAWGENSGLNWDEKYAAWIKSMPEVSPGGSSPGFIYYKTFMLTTPWGQKIVSPSLECAELSMFLRATFSAWYELPFFMEASASGQRLFFGHFGVRTASDRWGTMPEFGSVYSDYSGRSDLATNWPKDSRLARKSIDRDDSGKLLDPQPMMEDAPLGAYLDAIHANKRAGYFTVLLLSYFYSGNLADSANTYNLVPEALREGDTLLERWQKKGIGHTLVVKNVEKLEAGQLSAELVSGSMPRRLGKWASTTESKNDFTTPATGGPGIASDGSNLPYSKLGGGLKRWRVAKNINGYWTNTFMQGDESKWINDQDSARIAERVERFQNLLGMVPPEQQREALLAIIKDARGHLANYPASCSARTRREDAFKRLYQLGYEYLSMTSEQIDREYRKLEDYVFAELDYPRAKTCCWNSTTPEMYAVIMDYADSEQNGQCKEPTVFGASQGGYDLWARHASSLGKSWRAWSEDEPCAQRGTDEDARLESSALPWCNLEDR